ncbi:hypothetical protein [Streptomyces sp. NBC_01615]|uniref:hypothetical protein n=1 Tax=Streptomyces sp. NBC_01615 TaxID=2975898 RepID=UPI00386B4DF8
MGGGPAAAAGAALAAEPGRHWQAAPAARQAELEKLYSTLLTGGLLNRIVLAQATRYALLLDWFDGAVLFWEEGGHASHVWSYLQVLRHSGILVRISGMVVGVPHEIDGIGAPEASPTLPEIVLDVLGDQ